MDRKEKWRWQFFAFESAPEGCPVQVWFNALPDDDRDEVVDLLEYLQKTTDKLWPEVAFDPLEGAGGISEIKIPNIRCFRDNKYKEVTYRIYGFFGPRGCEHSYTFLHGTDKDVRNDIVGKQIAKGRLDETARGTAGVRKFDFSGQPSSKTTQRQSRTN